MCVVSQYVGANISCSLCLLELYMYVDDICSMLYSPSQISSVTMLSSSFIDCVCCHKLHGGMCIAQDTCGQIRIHSCGSGGHWKQCQCCMVCHPRVGLHCVSLGCSLLVTVGEHRIVIRSYAMPVVMAVAHYYLKVGVIRCVLFCLCPLLDTNSTTQLQN